MNSTHPNLIDNGNTVENILRLIATLPAPGGIEDRIHAALKAAPPAARVLAWPGSFHPAGSWMRGAAAAAIVFVVAGGGWGIYSRVQPAQPAKVMTMPPRTGAATGFSSAAAVRTPQTLNGPVLAHPVAAQAQGDKLTGRPVKTPLRKAQSAVVEKTAVQADAPPPPAN